MPISGSVYIASHDAYHAAFNTALGKARCGVANVSICAYSLLDGTQVSSVAVCDWNLFPPWRMSPHSCRLGRRLKPRGCMAFAQKQPVDGSMMLEAVLAGLQSSLCP